jgi:hypothetical protein
VIIKVTRRLDRQVRYIQRTADRKNWYAILVRNPEGQSTLRILGNKLWEKFVKSDEDVRGED